MELEGSGAKRLRDMSEAEIASVRSQISQHLSTHPASTAKQIARALEQPKVTVNSVLYGSPREFLPDSLTPPRWSPNPESGTEQRPADSAGNGDGSLGLTRAAINEALNPSPSRT